MRRQSPVCGLAELVVLAAVCQATHGQTVIVDNADLGFSVISENWSTTSGSGQYGADYRYRSTSLTSGVVEWRPTLAAAGEYEVSVWYLSTGSGRPNNAHYTVEHEDGTTDVYINQQINGSQWVSLGDFTFSTGTSAYVRLESAAQPGKTIVADAVRFRPLFGSPSASEMRACWLTHYYFLGKTEAQIRAAAQNMLAGNINTVYIAAYSGASTFWPSKAYQSAGGSWSVSSFDLLAYIVDIFRSEGLKVGAWFEYGMAVGTASHTVAVANPDWLARDMTGDPVTGENGGFVFLSPGHPDAMNMLVEMSRELAENYAFDDIQLDRFRWGRKVIGQGREYGYEDATSNLYLAQYGVTPPSNRNDSTWVAFREDLVNDAVQQCYAAIKGANPNILVSSAPTGSYGITQHMQRWSDWMEGDYMDLVMPQMYMTSLSSFITEFNTQLAQAPGHLDKLAVGYRAQDDSDYALVIDQLNHARGAGVNHGCLWVYHQYTSQVAIQDEIDNLPLPGMPWEVVAENPYTSDRFVQIIIDNAQGSPAYQETGVWVGSAQPDYLKFDSRVSDGSSVSTATFSAVIPKSGRYDVYVWYTASGNRNAAASYTIQHFNGPTEVLVDQQTGGGAWVPIGTWIFQEGNLSHRVTITTEGSAAGEYTSADGVKLVLSGYALGDADGDGDVDLDDNETAVGCLTGPQGSPLPADCEAFDIDDDGDADLRDWAAIQTLFTG